MAKTERWRARWVLPVTAQPIRDGAVAFVDGVIVACGPAGDVARAHADLPERDLGDALISPGFVDTHCHLEWSLLDGLLPPGRFAGWLSQMLPIRRRYQDGAHEIAARLGALRCLENGTTTVADSGPAGAGAAALGEAGLRGIVGLEVVGREDGVDAHAVARRILERLGELGDRGGDRVAVGVAPHAPYSIGPDLWRALADEPAIAGRTWTTHLAESAAEVELLEDGTGALADLFEAVGIEPGRWPAGTQSSPVARLHAHGALEQLDVAAHCVQLVPGDELLLAGSRVSVAHCPRSNAFLECGIIPLRTLLGAGVTVGLGSDSPASGGGYDVRAESRAAADVARSGGDTPPSWHALLEMATHAGARALGVANIGELAAGRPADLVAVEAPEGAPIDDDPARALLDVRARVVRVAIAGETLLDRSGPAHLDTSSIVSAADGARAALC